jgi:hypothetical protein
MAQLKIWDGSAWVEVPGAIGDHGVLTGLGDDDHPQYLLADGSRSLAGNLGVDGGVTVDGRDISADGSKLDGIEAGAVADHGNLAGLGDDDHTQYALADGSRDISGLLTFLAGLTSTAGNTTLGITTILGNMALTKSSPLVTWYNTLNSDADGGRRTDILFGGNLGSGTPHYLARQRVEHDGAAADQMARMIVYLNLAASGLGTGTEALRLDQYGLKTFSGDLADYYQDPGAQTLTPSAFTKLTGWLTGREDTGSFSISGDTVTANYTGWARVGYHISAITDSTVSTRAEAEWHMLQNAVAIPGMLQYSYHRSIVGGTIIGRNNASSSRVIAVTSGDTFTIEGRALADDIFPKEMNWSFQRVQQP